MQKVVGSNPISRLVQKNLTELENRLWDAADELRANSGLKSSEFA